MAELPKPGDELPQKPPKTDNPAITKVGTRTGEPDFNTEYNKAREAAGAQYPQEGSYNVGSDTSGSRPTKTVPVGGYDGGGGGDTHPPRDPKIVQQEKELLDKIRARDSGGSSSPEDDGYHAQKGEQFRAGSLPGAHQEVVVAESGSNGIAESDGRVIAKDGSTVGTMPGGKVIAESGSNVEVATGAHAKVSPGAHVRAHSGAVVVDENNKPIKESDGNTADVTWLKS